MKVELRRIRLNSGGYDNKGRYYGVDLPLYEYRLELPDTFECLHLNFCSEPSIFGKSHCSECGGKVFPTHNHDVCEDIRAYDREHAKDKIRKLYPEARFYR